MTQVIETDEAGRLVLSPEMLGEVKPHMRYTVEAEGAALIVKPEETSVQRQKVYHEWKREWDALTEQISASWNTDKSAAEIIAEMRR
jgi:hypothetical protein